MIDTSPDSSVGIATDYRLHGLGSNPGRAQRFHLLHYVQTGSGAHPLSYPTCTTGCLLSVKLPTCAADYSPPPSAEVETSGVIPPLTGNCDSENYFTVYSYSM
jgi:hypothetical protein